MKREDRILLAHGGGGKLTRELIERLFLPFFKNSILSELGDSAVLEFENLKLAFTTDSYTVDPIFFPGGDIGSLSIYGTVNDLAMMGATPLYISASLIIEEGFPMEQLERITRSMKEACSRAGVYIVTGDTKVVGKGMADKIYITTAGIGIIPVNISFSFKNIREGDFVIINGPIGEHGIAILMTREGITLEGDIKSDSQPLNHIVEEMVKIEGIKAMRDLTRGGLGAVLCEIASATGLAIHIEEEAVPIKPEVLSACEILGLDPLYVANEGKFIAIVSQDAGEEVLKVMREREEGKDSKIIGRIERQPKGKVVLRTKIGGSRIVEMPIGEELPRIC
ncbi:hydrogenase expression/formation protein HypE [bacterium]|nr:hydrogenase expression/formation protein HypE [bacterium]